MNLKVNFFKIALHTVDRIFVIYVIVFKHSRFANDTNSYINFEAFRTSLYPLFVNPIKLIGGGIILY